jgi:3-hydroxyisobutyrate dehydrogenase-like beta-hydroxyacid dehydrogenase
VPKGYHVQDVYLNEKTGVVQAQHSGKGDKIFFEMSTIEGSITKEVGQKVMDAKLGTYFDSPISVLPPSELPLIAQGGVPGAKDATLSFMISLPPTDPLRARVEAIASTMGRPDRIFFCGKLGNGLAAKVANNYIAVINLLATAEAMNIGIRSGIDKHTMFAIIHNSTGQSFMGDVVCPVPGVVKTAPASNGYALGFRTEMMPKDLGLAIDQAKEVGAPLVLGQPTIDLYRNAGNDPRCHVCS